MSKAYLKLNLGKFKQATEKARLELAKIIVKDTKQFVPHDKGKLEKAEIVNNGRQIIYSTPYARFLWYGKLMLEPNGSSWARKGEKKHVVNKDLKFNQSVNPYAGKYWFLRAKNKYLDKCIIFFHGDCFYAFRIYSKYSPHTI